MSTRIRLLIADDHSIVRIGLTSLFENEPDIEVVGQAVDGKDAIAKALQLKPKSILVVEGIHALNPKLTAQVDDALKFRVYVSALTQIVIDDLNLIRTSDNRLIRRIVRDNNFRGWGAEETLMRWPSVRAGERQHIFPFQENADVMFNSALLYELGVLRNYAEPQLKRVPQCSPQYAAAQRLLQFVSLIEPINPKFIPPTSIMCEFLGGSSFEY